MLWKSDVLIRYANRHNIIVGEGDTRHRNLCDDVRKYHQLGVYRFYRDLLRPVLPFQAANLDSPFTRLASESVNESLT